MSAINQSGQALQDAAAALEGAVKDLGTKISTEISDFQAAVTADLAAAGVPTSVVDAVTARITALAGTVTNLASSVTAADPGPQTPAPVAGDGGGPTA